MRFAIDERPEIEYRSPDDEAWYSVALLLVDDVLIVRYDGFSSDHDEVFPAEDSFVSSEEIGRFGARFRPASVQMQDSQCRTVKEGEEVCASCHFDTGDVKFYDATVAEVQYSEHVYDNNGNERCSCMFLLLWHHGPLSGTVTPAKVANICLPLKNKQTHPTLVSFLKKASKKLLEAAESVPEGSNSYLKNGEPVVKQSSWFNGASKPPLPPSNFRELKCDISVNEDGEQMLISSPCNKGLLMSKTTSHMHGVSGLTPSFANESSSKPNLSLHIGGVVKDAEMKRTNECNASHEQNSNIDLDFCMRLRARRAGRLAVRTTKGRLYGMCKKH